MAYGKFGYLVVAVVMVLSWTGVSVFAGDDDEAASVGEALREGSFDIGLRYRFENVSVDGVVKDGNASTLRSTFGYRSKAWNGFGVEVQFEDVTDLGLDDQHANAGAGSLNNGVTGRPTIADPEITEVLRANLWWRGADGTMISVGRDEINLGEQRFVGAVGWRQHHQSFDAAQLSTKAIPRTTLDYAYLDRQHRIFGDERAMGSHALFAAIDAEAAGTVTLYGLQLDYDDVSFAGVSTDTFGIRWKASFAPNDDWSIPVHLEFAQQSDAGENPAEVDADYLRAEIGAKCDAWWFRLGSETLSGDATDGRFTTPLATLHKWNGWADQFLNTPATGLEDLYLGAGFKRDAWSGAVFFHDFASDSTSVDYGTEIDAVVTWKAPWKQRFSLKAASFSADSVSFSDVDKIWFETAFTF